jgi:hypothetical protein
MSYRQKCYGDNPTHQVIVGFDDTLRTLFARVVDLDTRDQMLDCGQTRVEIQSLQDLLDRISPFRQHLALEIQQALYAELKSCLPHIPQPLFDSH